MIYCTKKGERPVDAPCPLGYENRRYLGLEKGESYIYLCGKR